MLTYEPLRNLLDYKGIKLTDLIKEGGFSSSTVAKINKDEPIRFDVLDRFCSILDVSVEEIIQYRDESGNARYFNKSKGEYEQVVQELLDLRKKYEQLEKNYSELENDREKRKYEKSETIRFRIKNLKSIRKSHNLTQKDIADVLGLNYIHYARFERGVQLLNEKQLNEIRAILSIPNEEIEEVRE
ncbi:helix-turn-helix transcriptional regulator [Paenibacillus xylaniclasticus]|uniref:helix-turn-helix transcriptional regulator n=1 Tax=Paenibacillus xylaniclasticus TaxID=588083 RepID=UPI000FD75ED2|nr:MULTISPECIES: helix-turn-helix transcriptional regulator [Paenibacillus]GFN32526.1 hypothetical protein PCURB6_27860 [Paenibacillus curdlanolyticus]